MNKLIQTAKILSDKNRIYILALMKRDKELCVCEICDTLSLSQPLVSRSLKQMREAGLVTAKQNGKWMLYSLRENTLVNCFLDKIDDEIIQIPKTITCAKE